MGGRLSLWSSWVRKALVGVLCVVPYMAGAQTAPDGVRPQVGCVAYGEALTSMQGYAAAVEQMDTLAAKYDAEVRRSEEEFNAKYEEFLEGEAEFPATILKKRQTELQEMMDKNIAFRDESRRLLEAARQEAFAPLHAQLREAIASVAASMGLWLVVNADENTCLYIDTATAVDITQQVKDALNQ